MRSSRAKNAVPEPVLVTGASSGIGRALVAALVERGVRTLASVRRREDAEDLTRELGSLVDVVRFDVADEGSVRQALAGVERLGALVNNAGIAVAGPLEVLPLERFRNQLEVNLTGQLAVIQAVLPALRAHGPGARIVTVGSVGGRVAGPLLGAYHASKFALAGLTDSLRAELEDDGIGVSLVEPGVVATPIWERGVAGGDQILDEAPPEAVARYGARIDRLRRGARRNGSSGMPAEEVASAVIDLLTDPSPPPRLLVGRMARIVGIVDRLPDPLRYRLLGRARR